MAAQVADAHTHIYIAKTNKAEPRVLRWDTNANTPCEEGHIPAQKRAYENIPLDPRALRDARIRKKDACTYNFAELCLAGKLAETLTHPPPGVMMRGGSYSKRGTVEMLHSARRSPVCGRLVYSPSGAVANLVLKMECTNSCGRGEGQSQFPPDVCPSEMLGGFLFLPDGAQRRPGTP
ncbi:hypothetical protein Bbelb_189810 [Branchiostoma belcheri]|nr:hypothetical protein Bbelb_189810 [Branchiostoma belcheri]